jgi:hypothetical protein
MTGFNTWAVSHLPVRLCACLLSFEYQNVRGLVTSLHIVLFFMLMTGLQGASGNW